MRTDIQNPEVVEFLEGRRIASLATLDHDGSIQQTAVWYLYRDRQLMIPTVSTYRKVAYLRTRPQASVMVDSRSMEGMKGVCVEGGATILEGPEALELNMEIHARYLTEAAAAHPVIGPAFDEGDDTTIVIDCDRVRFWDMTVGELGVLFDDPAYLHTLDP